MLTEIDDSPLPAAMFIRFCCAPECGEIARKSGRYCKRCNAAAQSRWRKKNRVSKNMNRRAAAPNRPEEEKLRDVARAKLAVYISRGKLTKGACVECASPRVTAYIADPRKWREVVWACRDHRDGTIHDIEDRERAKKARDEQGDRMRRGLAAFEALPGDVQAVIRERAGRGFGIPLAAESPLFLQRVVAETEKLAAIA